MHEYIKVQTNVRFSIFGSVMHGPSYLAASMEYQQSVWPRFNHRFGRGQFNVSIQLIVSNVVRKKKVWVRNGVEKYVWKIQ